MNYINDICNKKRFIECKSEEIVNKSIPKISKISDFSFEWDK